jgi:hypothetical protein
MRLQTTSKEDEHDSDEEECDREHGLGDDADDLSLAGMPNCLDRTDCRTARYMHSNLERASSGGWHWIYHGIASAKLPPCGRDGIAVEVPNKARQRSLGLSSALPPTTSKKVCC